MMLSSQSAPTPILLYSIRNMYTTNVRVCIILHRMCWTRVPSVEWYAIKMCITKHHCAVVQYAMSVNVSSLFIRHLCEMKTFRFVAAAAENPPSECCTQHHAVYREGKSDAFILNIISCKTLHSDTKHSQYSPEQMLS